MADETVPYNADPIQQYQNRLGALRTERSSWYAHWQEITTFLLPRNGRYFVQDRNKGYRRHNAILDSTGTKALRTLSAGLMSGLTSPARPWFRLGTHDPGLMKSHAVKAWLAQCTDIMLVIFQRSNTYRTLHGLYEELGAFGTGVSIIGNDYENVIHHYPVTTGEYMIAQDWGGTVCTLYREFQKDVGSIVKEFGYKNCSPTVRNMYDKGQLDQWVTLVEAIEPRADRDITKKDVLNMAFKQVTYERDSNQRRILRESGYKEFPALCPRWSLAGGDIYGTSPGMEGLGDIKQLQHQQLRKAEVIDFKTKPPLQVPAGMKNRDVERMPGGITYTTPTGGNDKIQTLFDVNLDLDHLLGDIQDVRQRINGVFYADVFTMLASMPHDSRMTATEVAERHEEKMIMLGPVLERLQNELLDPLIERTFARMIQVGIVPPPPKELQDQQLNIELVSMLAQAQKAVQTNSIDRFVGNLGQVAQFKSDVLDKFNADAWADQYADMTGVPPDMIVSNEQVTFVRADRAKQQAAAEQNAQLNVASETAANLGKVNTGGKNAATDIIQNLTGYNA